MGWDCDYDFLDEEFMEILHDCYNDFLSTYNYGFASGTDGLEWETAYAEYIKTLMDRVEDWVSDREGETIGPSSELFRLMKPRLQFLLRKEASHQMPLLRGMCNTPPLFCPRYYIDMGVELNGMEDVGIHVSKLFALSSISSYVGASVSARYLRLCIGPTHRGRFFHYSYQC
jgi:hypothetical protein